MVTSWITTCIFTFLSNHYAFGLNTTSAFTPKGETDTRYTKPPTQFPLDPCNPIEPCNEGDRMAYPDDCEQHYWCTHRTWVPTACPTTCWDVPGNLCERCDLADCHLPCGATLGPITNDTDSVLDPCNPEEPCVPDTMMPVPGSCTLFMRCVNTRWVQYECPEDHRFNPDNSRCDQIYQVPDCFPECTTGSPVPIGTVGPFDPCDLENTCRTENVGQRVGYPYNCSTFYTCQLGQMVPQTCGIGNCFDVGREPADCVQCFNASKCQPPCPTTVTYPDTTTLTEGSTTRKPSATTMNWGITTEGRDPLPQLPPGDDSNLVLLLAIVFAIIFCVCLGIDIWILFFRPRKHNKVEPESPRSVTPEIVDKPDLEPHENSNGGLAHATQFPPIAGAVGSSDTHVSFSAPPVKHSFTGPPSKITDQPLPPLPTYGAMLAALPENNVDEIPLTTRQVGPHLTDFERVDSPRDGGPAIPERDMTVYLVEEGGDKETLVEEPETGTAKKKKKKKKKKKHADDEEGILENDIRHSSHLDSFI